MAEPNNELLDLEQKMIVLTVKLYTIREKDGGREGGIEREGTQTNKDREEMVSIKNGKTKIL